ncbi:MAG: hypothetical protein AAGJ18_12620 [Bacteroidota bacterium]
MDDNFWNLATTVLLDEATPEQQQCFANLLIVSHKARQVFHQIQAIWWTSSKNKSIYAPQGAFQALTQELKDITT